MIHLMLAAALVASPPCPGSGTAHRCMIPTAPSPRKVLEGFDAHVKARLSGKRPDRKGVEAKVAEVFDLDAMARAAAGDAWKGWDDGYRANYVKLFRSFVLRRYVDKLVKRRNYVVSFLKERISGTTATVVTSINKRGANPDDAIEVVYKLRRAGRTWRVVDVVTDEVSLVDTYRSMFRDVLRKKGPQGLLEYLKGTRK